MKTFEQYLEEDCPAEYWDNLSFWTDVPVNEAAGLVDRRLFPREIEVMGAGNMGFTGEQGFPYAGVKDAGYVGLKFRDIAVPTILMIMSKGMNLRLGNEETQKELAKYVRSIMKGAVDSNRLCLYTASMCAYGPNTVLTEKDVIAYNLKK
jgi:hypothetical protein